MTEIHLLISDQMLSVSEKPVVASGAKNSVKVICDFEGELWNVCGKQAVFWNDKTPSEICPMPLDAENSCLIPACVLENEGYFYIGIVGYANDGETRKTSTVVKYQLKKGAPDGTGEVVEEPPDAWEQCLAIMGETVNAANEAVSTANEAKEIAEDAAEKLNLAYVDDEGIMHIYTFEAIAKLVPEINITQDETHIYFNVTNVDGSGQTVAVEIPEDGEDGSSCTIEVTEITGGHRLTIRDASGEKTVDVMDGAELPGVTSDDNGKILQVVDGIWAAVNVADSEVATYVDEYISSALEGDY